MTLNPNEESPIVDVNGRSLKKGDMVATLNDNLTAKICALQFDGDIGFVSLRAVHQPFSRGVWHSADHVQLISPAKISGRSAPNRWES